MDQMQAKIKWVLGEDWELAMMYGQPHPEAINCAPTHVWSTGQEERSTTQSSACFNLLNIC